MHDYVVNGLFLHTLESRISSVFQESYVTHEDRLRLAGEVISIVGAFVILLLEVI